MIELKRIFEKPDPSDGYRILVDRLWPRGMTREKAAIDLWFKEIAPSDELRKWFHHEVPNWEEFRARYEREIRDNQVTLEKLKAIIKKEKTVTLLYGAKDEKHNQALVIKDLL